MISPYGKQLHPKRENTNIYALIAYCSFHLILCNSSPGHLSHYCSRNTYYKFPETFRICDHRSFSRQSYLWSLKDFVCSLRIFSKCHRVCRSNCAVALCFLLFLNVTFRVVGKIPKEKVLFFRFCCVRLERVVRCCSSFQFSVLYVLLLLFLCFVCLRSVLCSQCFMCL